MAKMIDSERPTGYKGYQPPLDLTRKIPKPIRKPKLKGPPLSLYRKTPKPGRRIAFFDPEDVTLATLAGPNAIRTLLLEAHQELLDIRGEVDRMIKRYLPDGRTPGKVDISAQECNASPFGLCVYDKYGSEQHRDCIYCKKLED